MVGGSDAQSLLSTGTGLFILCVSELLMVTMLSPSLPAPQYDHKRISKLAERLTQKIMRSLPDVVMNGDPEHHYPGVDMPFLSPFWKSPRL